MVKDIGETIGIVAFIAVVLYCLYAFIRYTPPQNSAESDLIVEVGR